MYFIELFQQDQNGFSDLEILNFGGGLGINYHHDHSDTDVPGPDELVAAVAPHLLNTKFTVMIEPGRSLIGNAGIWEKYLTLDFLKEMWVRLKIIQLFLVSDYLTSWRGFCWNFQCMIN